MKHTYSTDDKTIIAVCALVIACAVYTIVEGSWTVRVCGSPWVLGTLEVIFGLTFGIVPLVVVLVALGAAALIPALRNVRFWVASAGALSGLAVIVVAVAIHQFPVPSNPVSCSL